MASIALKSLRDNVRTSPIGGCVSPSEPYWDRCAATLRKWDILETIGAVRLRAVPDETWEPIDCGDPRCKMNDPNSEAYGSIGEYRTDFADPSWHQMDVYNDDLPWECADSVWGHVGYRDVLDWRENVHILDIMAETIRQFAAAWKAHVRANRKATPCPKCQGSGTLPWNQETLARFRVNNPKGGMCYECHGTGRVS
jgi:hypothetical protein